MGTRVVKGLLEACLEPSATVGRSAAHAGCVVLHHDFALVRNSDQSTDTWFQGLAHDSRHGVIHGSTRITHLSGDIIGNAIADLLLTDTCSRDSAGVVGSIGSGTDNG